MCARKRKKKLTNIKIEGFSSEAMGIYRHEGKVVFVEQTIPGDVVDIEIYKNKKGHGIAAVQEMITPSVERIEPFCQHFEDCGGCKTQYLPYALQLKHKEQVVTDAFSRIGQLEAKERLPILGCKETQYYRNKLEYSFSNKAWIPKNQADTEDTIERKSALGFHVPKFFDKIVDIEKCHLQVDISNQIRNATRDFALKNEIPFYDFRAHKGALRNLMIRTTSLGEILVLLSSAIIDDSVFALLDHLHAQFPEITALQYVHNTKRNDTIFDLEVVPYKGKSTVKEKLGHCTFELGAKSFFQTNTRQAEQLYAITKDFAGLKNTDVVYDLYCGVGSIGIYCADACASIIGIEIVPEAIEDAKKNAASNEVENAQFFAGDMKDVLNADFYANYRRPDVVLLDPPRAGLHKDVVEQVIALNADKVVYVSCNPATQARDIDLMRNHYQITKMQAVDLFPHTIHIENVCLLEKI